MQSRVSFESSPPESSVTSLSEIRTMSTPSIVVIVSLPSYQ